MAISGVRFGHVAFRVADVDRAVKWYADAFGARKVFHGEPQAGRQELMFLEFAPGQHIEIFTNGTERVSDSGQCHRLSALLPGGGRYR